MLDQKMKGPSLDAIRRFKEQQELKKRQDEERKIKEKLTTLEHRASQGDKKAKQNLKRFEQIKSDPNKSAPVEQKQRKEPSQDRSRPPQHVVPKPKKVVADFDELMKLARTNNNELRKNEEPKPSMPLPKLQSHEPKLLKKSFKEHREAKPHQSNDKARPPRQAELSTKKPSSANRVINVNPKQQVRRDSVRESHRARINEVSRFARFQNHRVDDYEDEEYEQDDFIVDDEDDDAQEELKKTLRSVFRYDSRRCDLREQELDREYRAIGHVSTFEDLEREERRASRLAAMEDAKAQREEEDRKRLKKLRLRRD